jgi:LysR family transcriptional regulator, transcriptional activator for leuABCD operon
MQIVTTELLVCMICTMLNLRGVDLNLLPVFEAVYEEQSLSRAAERLAMTQPAVSHALTRLRAVFRDELFVRRSTGVAATSAADQIYFRLRDALSMVRDSVTDRRAFDPATSERHFFITIPHPLGPMITLRLQNRFAKIAPNISVAASTRSRPIDLDRAVHEGRVDAVIDWLPVGGDEINELVVFEDALVPVAREGHPALLQPASKKTLRDGGFVRLRPRIEGVHPLEGFREWQRLKLNTVLEVSEILEILMVVSQSDLFGLIPRSMEKVALETVGIRPVGWAPKAPLIPIKLYWHASREADPAHAFLRTELATVSTELVQGR